ncbi:MAG: hypothetical protein ACKOD2_09150 [Ilumatobacteraceae bacterium]
MLDRIEPSVKALLVRVEDRTGFAAPSGHGGHDESHSTTEGEG